MSLKPQKPQRNPSVSLVAHSNVGFWAEGTPCPFADREVFRLVSYDPNRPKGKKTELEELELDRLEPPLWFAINQSKKAIVLNDDQVKSITFKGFERAALRESGNVVCSVERTLKNGAKDVYQIPPMHPELFDEMVGGTPQKKSKRKRKGKTKRPRAEEDADESEQTSPKKSKPLPEPPVEEVPPPISHIADDGIVGIFDWTGAHGLYCIGDAIGEEGLLALEAMILDKDDLDPVELFDTDSWYTNYWMPGLLKLKTLPFAKECPLSIPPERSVVAMECLKNGFLIVLHIYRNLEVTVEPPPFVQTAFRDWMMYRTLPITEWALTGPGLKNAETWDKGMKTASTPPGDHATHPEYGCATVLGMFLAFAFYVTYSKSDA